MIRQLIKKRRKQILVDINTQRDFFLAEGAACIRNHRRVLARVRRIMAWARNTNTLIISICQINPNGNGNGNHFDYCIDGTQGQKKIRYSLLDNRATFAADSSTHLPTDLLYRYHQIIFHKRSNDPFEEPLIERLLTELKAEEFILVGACAEDAVKSTALGLLQRGKKVRVVVDAVGSHDKREARLALRKVEAKGGKLIETRKLAGISHLRHVGICSCDSCQGKNRKSAKMNAED